MVALLAGGGGYAEQALAHPSVTFPLPDAVDDLTALALVLQGTTAWHLLRTSAHLRRGESVVVHSGAGGVGSLAVQLARRLGRRPGHRHGVHRGQARRWRWTSARDAAVDVSGAGRRRRARGAWSRRTTGRPVDIVLEMTGGPVFDGSLAALAPFGRLVTYGLASRQRRRRRSQPGRAAWRPAARSSASG